MSKVHKVFNVKSPENVFAYGLLVLTFDFRLSTFNSQRVAVRALGLTVNRKLLTVDSQTEFAQC